MQPRPFVASVGAMPPRLSIALMVLALAACATTNHNKGSAPAGTPVQRFPDNAALQKLARNTPQTPPPELQFGGYPTWELRPNSVAGPEQAQVAALGPELATRARAQYSEALGCVAREFARSLAEHGALPASGVRRFIAGRCGAWISTPSARTWVLKVPPDVDAAQVEAQLRSTLASLFPAHFSRGRSQCSGLCLGDLRTGGTGVPRRAAQGRTFVPRRGHRPVQARGGGLGTIRGVVHGGGQRRLRMDESCRDGAAALTAQASRKSSMLCAATASCATHRSTLTPPHDGNR